jgi:hypothetical protein
LNDVQLESYRSYAFSVIISKNFLFGGMNMTKSNISELSKKTLGIGIDIKGRLRKVSFTTKPLLPLFEAISNSIHSIEDAKISNGKIVIRILRKDTPLINKKNNPEVPPIIGFEIEDNGIGFTDDNFNHFLTVDTTHKIKQGGKGVGRLSWLKAFDEIVIDSSFRDNYNKCTNRAFIFSLKDHTQNDCITLIDSQFDTNKPNQTVISMKGYKSEYQDKCPKKIETIAKQALDHCIDYFLSNDCPEIYFEEKNNGETFSLNQYFKENVLSEIDKRQFLIDDKEFTIKHVQLSPKYGQNHFLFYSANRRTVKSDDLAKLIPNLSSKFFVEENNDNKFIYVAYVESPFFDEKVNEDRNDFAIPYNEDLLGELNWKQIQTEIINNCKEYISPFISYIDQKKQDRIKQFINDKAPQYRPIIKYAQKELSQIPPDIDEDKLDLELYNIYQNIQKQTRYEGNEIFNKKSSNDDINDYEAKIDAYLTKISDISQSDLTRYVCHRKVVLNYLQKCLERDDDEHYIKEKIIHKAIFPMGVTSDEVPFSNHNLWVIDEKLVYHNFLASDKPINSFMNGLSADEPDIAIINGYDIPLSFSDSSPNEQLTSVVIIEFKRPMRNNYPKNEHNPIEQVYSYIEDIRAGKKTTKTGRPIPVLRDSIFYCYIICDITKEISKFAKNSGFTMTPDQQGFYCFNSNYNSYTEIISFDKMLKDATKRQTAFFDKLNIPNHGS